MKICLACNGTGARPCPQCGGTGLDPEHPEGLMQEEGNIELQRSTGTCTKCGGTGETVCNKCGGTGKIPDGNL